jgi:hypothetical protein
MSLCNYESLNKNGDQLIKYNYLSDEVRGWLKVDYAKDLEWQTFRDANEQAKSVFFHYTRAPRQGLSINDEWILKKEVIKLFEAGMYERAHASWSCFDPRFLFVWHCSIKLLQNWILKNPLSNPTMSIALFIPKWRYVSVYLQAHDIWDQTKHPFESTFHEDYAEVMYFWFWVLPSVAVTSLIYPYIFKFYNITTEKRFPVFHPALQWDPISWVDTCPVHLFHHIP